MKIFLDTSSLFKLYHREVGTRELEELFVEVEINQIFLSEITKVELNSTIQKKIRTKELTLAQGQSIFMQFDNDLEKYHFIMLDSSLIEQAKNLITKYGIESLRTLDSIQLASCVALINKVDIFITADKLLKELMDKEGLQTNF